MQKTNPPPFASKAPGLMNRAAFLRGCFGGALGLVCFGALRSDAQALGPRLDQAPQAYPMRVVRDPINAEINAFRHNVRQLYNASNFSELEKIAAGLRAAKARFGNGGWKVVQFYDALECRSDEPESMWQLHDQIHRNWIEVKPDSITARLAYAHFFCSYAWHARGNGYGDSVTPEGGKLFRQRLAAAHQIVDEARKLKEKDPYWGTVALRVALGEGPAKETYDAILEEARAAEPLFWSYDVSRAYSLLTRWYGEPGEWEAYALKAAARPDGLGAEVYARIVLHLSSFYGNIFDESDVSWPKTREGLELMVKRYPESLEIVNEAAQMAYLAKDRELARALFDRLNGACVLRAWSGPEQFMGALKWARKSDK